ncbi:MAG: sugar phosphate isomerase/epimerase [Bryobacterales bacterium]|nr:sugar phosphate isomerase/epimerase [Bryobacterales bacterium]
MKAANSTSILSRRGVLAGFATATLSMAASPRLAGQASSGQSLDIGVQLYMLRDLLAEDFERGLAQVAETGVKSVEFAGFYNRTASDISRTLRSNGLSAVSAHCVQALMSDDDLARMIDFCAELRMPYMCAAAPIIRHLKLPITSMEEARAAVRKITLDDMHESADRFNHLAERIHRAGMQFIYHTHGMDFRRYGDVVAFDDMVNRTDPSLVLFEMDFGNALAANADPIAYLHKYPTRFRLGHLKDWTKLNPADPTEIPPRAPFGEGVVDWKSVLRAGREVGIKTYFIEQEETSASNAISILRQGYQYFSELRV